MKKKSKSLLLGIITLIMVGCASQKDKGSQQGGPPSFSQLLEEMDTDKDGKLSKSEVKGPLLRDFSKIDSNEDGFISYVELKNNPQTPRGQRPPRNN